MLNRILVAKTLFIDQSDLHFAVQNLNYINWISEIIIWNSKLGSHQSEGHFELWKVFSQTSTRNALCTVKLWIKNKKMWISIRDTIMELDHLYAFLFGEK